jgi:hypothetical protein
VRLVGASTDALWALDFPVRLPVELFPARSGWPRQLALVREYRANDYGLGSSVYCRALALGQKMHIPAADGMSTCARAVRPLSLPIIYQTMHGMTRCWVRCGATAHGGAAVSVRRLGRRIACSSKRARRRRSSGSGYRIRITSSRRAGPSAEATADSARDRCGESRGWYA